MALKETELTETSSSWEPLQFYCLPRATFKRRTPPHLKVYDMTRRPMLLYYIYQYQAADWFVPQARF